MKKTLITLLALAGMTMAAEEVNPITLGSWFTDSQGNKQMTVDAVEGLSKENASALDGDGGFTADGAEGITVNTIFTINTAALYSTTTLQQGQVLDVVSIVLSSKQNTNNYADGNYRTLSITLNGTTYTSNPIQFSRTSGYGTMTYTFTGDNAFSFTLGDTLTASLNAINGTAHTAYGTFKGQTGVSNFSAPSNLTDWQAAVKINATPAIPEPTTATLSLLALAGLAARRRRK